MAEVQIVEAKSRITGEPFQKPFILAGEKDSPSAVFMAVREACKWFQHNGFPVRQSVGEYVVSAVNAALAMRAAPSKHPRKTAEERLVGRAVHVLMAGYETEEKRAKLQALADLVGMDRDRLVELARQEAERRLLA